MIQLVYFLFIEDSSWSVFVQLIEVFDICAYVCYLNDAVSCFKNTVSDCNMVVVLQMTQ